MTTTKSTKSTTSTTSTKLNTAVSLEILVNSHNLSIGDEVVCVSTRSSYFTGGKTYVISQTRERDCRVMDDTYDNYEPPTDTTFKLLELPTKPLGEYSITEVITLLKAIKSGTLLEVSPDGEWRESTSLRDVTTFADLKTKRSSLLIRFKPAMSAAQLKLEELEQQQRDLADAIAEVRKGL